MDLASKLDKKKSSLTLLNNHKTHRQCTLGSKQKICSNGIYIGNNNI